MAKGFNKLLAWTFGIAKFIGAFGIGAAFVSGLFLNVFVLNMASLLIHQIIGWVLIVAAVLGAVAPLLKK